ncbi:hypothetical protein BpHYR1_027727 [Brachionus plicatilis]|uniref:Uncharacterized protein n=1 Tax=Brachionus plicatilis TaxID=10195 RepID=A0A3M7SLA6_BRAPC|nr:hypothetical protein BpHYR1_027727 [Brachionus plicatilis]
MKFEDILIESTLNQKSRSNVNRFRWPSTFTLNDLLIKSSEVKNSRETKTRETDNIQSKLKVYIIKHELFQKTTITRLQIKNIFVSWQFIGFKMTTANDKMLSCLIE